jgi:hypothetical protein
MEALCKSINLDEKKSELAAITALFHDIARFEQFRQYRTFSDMKSINHAEMGVAILLDHNVLNDLEPAAREMVLTAIRHHNAIEVPVYLTEEQTLLCRLLRDADKLDIYKIALDYYINPSTMRYETVQVGIPDGNIVSPEVCEYVLLGKIVPYEKIRTVADFKMIQLGWVFDLNFTYSLQCVKKRGYISEIRKFLPRSSSDVQRAIAAVEKYLEERI